MKTLGKGPLYLVSFMGGGKSKQAKILAEIMGWDVLEMDALIVERMGISINAAFDDPSLGETYFRGVELEVLREASLRENLIVSTGGGAFCQPWNRDIMLESGVVVWIDVDPPIIQKRLEKKTDRPLARDPEKLAKLFEERRPLYAHADFRVHVDIEVPAEDVAERILRAISWPQRNS